MTHSAVMDPPRGAALCAPDASLPVHIDWQGVAAHLSANGLRMDLAFAPRRFLGGLANINLLIRVDDQWAVLRRPPSGPLPRGAHDMAREHQVLSALTPHLSIAPRALHYCGDTAVAGAPFQILAYVDGYVLRGDSIAPLPETAETGRALSAMLIDTLALIHAVDATAPGLASLGRPEGFLRRTANGWIARAGDILAGRTNAAIAFLADWLEKADLADASQPTLLHNDYKLDNMILRHGEIAPAVVVDWDMATRGDPLLDLATLLSYWAEPGDPESMHRLAQMPSVKPGFLNREQAAQAYADRTGRPLDRFGPIRVLAMFKLAVVFHQLHARYVGEGATDPRLLSFASLADELADFAADVARGRRF